MNKVHISFPEIMFHLFVYCKPNFFWSFVKMIQLHNQNVPYSFYFSLVHKNGSSMTSMLCFNEERFDFYLNIEIMCAAHYLGYGTRVKLPSSVLYKALPSLQCEKFA